MAARRCSTCNLNWPPVANVYDRCQKCGAATAYMGSVANPMTDEEARTLVKGLKFEEWLAKESPERRRRRQQAVDQQIDEIVTRAVTAARDRQRQVDDLNRKWRDG